MSNYASPVRLPFGKPPKLNLLGQGNSPDRVPALFRTPTKRKDKNHFPTTPRSVEKQKKILGAKLKRLMENNLRLNATNKMLKGTNKVLLDRAVVSIFLLHL